MLVLKKVKRHIAFFYVALMLIFKVAGLHAITHNADETDLQHCEVCVFTTVVSLTPFLEADIPDLIQKNNYVVEQKLKFTAQNVAFSNQHLSSYHLTRPPPFAS